MARPIIEVENLGKSYTIRHQQPGRGGYRRLSEELWDGARRLWRRPTGSTSDREEFWALKDVSFEVQEGEIVGIIGRNGAGKSTLLKILSRITEPTEGRVTLRGRVASLLEVGTGFHPELTGRENIFLNGAILGMTRAEVQRKFDEIVDFAGVEKFLDTPVKRYSSGMYVRLAFAVAAHLDPEILIVDEVLAVGDAEFQRKCLGKMSEAACGHRTVLFVSHNMAAIQALCNRALLLSDGRSVVRGSPAQVIQAYGGDKIRSQKFEKEINNRLKLQIAYAMVVDLSAAASKSGRLLNVLLGVFAPDSIRVEIAAWVLDWSGTVIGFAPIGSLMADTPVALSPGQNEIKISIDVSFLAVGSYSLTLEITKPFAEIYDRCEGCLAFEITSDLFDDVLNPLRQDWNVGNVLFPVELIAQNIPKSVDEPTPTA